MYSSRLLSCNMAIWSAYNALREVLRSFRGALMVQIMSRGLWTGRQFRAYRAISANTSLRFTCAVPFMLTMQDLQVAQGAVSVRILTDSTPSGTWTAIPTQQAKNRLPSNTYVQKNIVSAGGTFTGGTERELLRGNAGNGQGVSIDNIDTNVRLLPAGDYFFEILVTGTTSAVYYFEFEELDDM